MKSQEKIEFWLTKKSQSRESHKKVLKKLARVNEKKLNSIADEIHEQVFVQIDCLDCANCCKSIPPILNETDIRRISKYLGLKVNDFKSRYVTIDEDSDMVFKSSPCVFLESNNKCSIYEYRPKACREYPHTGNFEFAKNIRLHAVNTAYCPAVFHIIEELSKKTI